MNWKRLAGVSLLLNAVVLTWLIAAIGKPVVVREPRVSQPEIPGDTSVRASPPPGPALRQLNWRQIESTNYSEYIANLRSIGCPEQTIHDIVAADVAATLREFQSTSLSPISGAGTAWREDPERLVKELMEDSFNQPTTPSARETIVDLNNASENARYRTVWVGHTDSSPVRSGVGLSEPGAADMDLSRNAPSGAADASGDSFLLSPEMARQRWIATYISTRYGQQAWNGFQQDSAEFAGDIEALMQHLNIPIPEPPQSLQPVARFAP